MQRRIIVFPAWSDNPYINLLYLATRADGHTIIEVRTPEHLHGELAMADEATVLHVNWTSVICQAAPDEAQAIARLRDFKRGVESAKQRGMQLVWTVHNVLPHDARYLEHEIELHHFLADAADAIHIMAADTVDVVSEFYSLPRDRVTRIAHSSYQGVYGAEPSREEARAERGVSPDTLGVLFFGQMRPYKGLLTLLSAVSTAVETAERPISLLLAGKTQPDDLATIERALPSGIEIVRQHSFIADQEASSWFAAADVAVFPYERILNSGSLHLSATFGLPCILPDEAHLQREYGAEQWVRFYSRSDAPGSLARAILDTPADGRGDRAAAHAFAARHTPFDMSNDFLDLIRSLER